MENGESLFLGNRSVKMDGEKKSKCISRKGLSQWEDAIRDNYDFIFDDTGDKAVLAKCKICLKHCDKIKNFYKGKIVSDIETFGREGTRHLLKPNLKRHIDSDGHRKCLEYETGQPLCKQQKTLTTVMGCAKSLAKISLKPLLTASLFIGRKEKPYSEFPDLLETCGEMGLQNVTKAFCNDKAAKVFNHIIAGQMRNNLRESVSKSHFFSWLVDGSAAAKRRLTYEAELLYIRTAVNLHPKTELFSFIPMKSYGSVNSDNLLHAVIKELATLGDKELEKQSFYTDPVDTVPMETVKTNFTEKDFHLKNIGAGADGASVNFGCRRGLMQQFKTAVSNDWLVSVHCFSHRLELAAGDSIKSHFSDIEEFLTSIYLHFRNSSKEWSLVCKMADKLGMGALTQPKSSGTRFLPHVLKALITLRYNWGLYILHFSNVKEENRDKDLTAKATAWLKKLLDSEFLARCRVYEDVVQHLSITAKLFQANDAQSVADATSAFQTMKMKQELLTVEAGECEEDLWQRLDAGEIVAPDEVVHLAATTRSARAPNTDNCVKISFPCKKIRQGAQDPSLPKSQSKFMNSEHSEKFVVTNVVSRESVAQLRSNVLQELDLALGERFREFENETHILSKTKFIDTKLWPRDIKDLSKFGIDEVGYILHHFHEPLQNAGIESDVDVLREFKDLKVRYGPRLASGELKFTAREFWPWLQKEGKEQYKNILLIVELVLCILFSTAEVERGFSAVRRILTDWRCSLGPELVGDCLHFSSRKTLLQSRAVRESLVDRACDTFLSENDKNSDGLGLLTKRRISKILGKLQPETPVCATATYIVAEESFSGLRDVRGDNEDTLSVSVSLDSESSDEHSVSESEDS